MPRLRTIYLISLGCPKNTVDSEVMLGLLVRGGYTPVPEARDAEVIVVNTCGFIDEAKQESIDAIIEMGRLKKTGRLQTLVVAGCLSQLYAPQLAHKLPEVDHFVGTGSLTTILEVIEGVRPEKRRRSLPMIPSYAKEDAFHLPDRNPTTSTATPRLRTGPYYTTYLKVSEGCSNACAFCLIPRIRGPQQSRPTADIVREMDLWLSEGTVEINLIAQDLCAYGADLAPRQSLAQLLRALDEIADRHAPPIWIRCLYAYPRGLTRSIIDTLARARHILPYLDVPLQHISDRILRKMHRGKGGQFTRALVRRLRDNISNLTLRTTFITGLPGETDEDFAELQAFMEEMRFERVGVFAYSPQEGTAAAEMPDQVDPEIAAERRDRLMHLAKVISRRQQHAMIGKSLDVLVDGVCAQTELLLSGRHAGQAPEIDGVTYINRGIAAPGEVVRVRIDQAGDYDLVGGVVEDGSISR
jgi:ribosomal protein S12 methylthiotransferase